MFIEVNMIKGTDYYISNSKRSLEFEFMGFQKKNFFYYVYKNIFEFCMYFYIKKVLDRCENGSIKINIFTKSLDVNKVYSIPDFQFSRKLYN